VKGGEKTKEFVSRKSIQVFYSLRVCDVSEETNHQKLICEFHLGSIKGMEAYWEFNHFSLGVSSFHSFHFMNTYAC
jgi:hypothetical protein